LLDYLRSFCYTLGYTCDGLSEAFEALIDLGIGLKRGQGASSSRQPFTNISPRQNFWHQFTSPKSPLFTPAAGPRFEGIEIIRIIALQQKNQTKNK
jgi:hypothetical protein